MENNTPSTAPFEIGQKVVAIRSLINNHGYSIKKGKVYTVLKIQKEKCQCGYWIIDIGLKTNNTRRRCPICDSTGFSHGVVWARHYHFAPYNPPRHQSVEIADEILKIKIVEERADVLKPEIVNN